MSDGGKRMAVFGASGSGKTFFVKGLIADMDRIVVFDPEEEYGALKGFHEVRSLKALREVLADCWYGSFKLAYVPQPMKEEPELHNVALLIERIGEAYRLGHTDKKLMLVVDELNLSFPLNVKPEHSGFARLCSRGRKRGINIIGISQRPAEIATRFRGNLSRIAAFKQTLPNDWAVIREVIGQDAEKAVRELPEYGHVFWENGAWEPVPPGKKP